MELSAILDTAVELLGTQAAVARSLGTAEPTVSRWYSGRSLPDYESCLRIARITGHPAAVVLRAAGRDPQLLPVNDRDEPDDPELESAVAEARRILQDRPATRRRLLVEVLNQQAAWLDTLEDPAQDDSPPRRTFARPSRRSLIRPKIHTSSLSASLTLRHLDRVSLRVGAGAAAA